MILQILFLVSGTIELLDYDPNEIRTWSVYSDCKLVRMISTMFETYSSYGPDEFLTISDTKYNNNTVIDTILPTNFTVAFHPGGTSWKGFVLNWKCLSQWEEWTPLGDGTCREVMGTQPPYNGPDFTYRTKYRRNNETCSMLYKYIFILR